MATSRPFAYNTGSAIAGTEQVGDIAIGTPTSGFTSTGLIWWNGPDEDLGYVIAHTVPSGTQPNPVGVPAYIGFWRTSSKTDNDFISLSEYVSNLTGTPQTFADTLAAKTWLNSEGYWTSYTPTTSLVLSLDAGDPASYPGTGTVWTDTVGGKQFNLINGPGYDPANGGKFYFFAPGGQYSECSTSLPSLPEFTTSVWHNWDGSNTGGLPCILTEVYVGGSINYFLGNLLGSVAQSGYFNGGFQVSPQFTLTANNWYYIVTTCDSSQNVKVYINNTLVSTTATGGAVPSSSNAGIRLMRRWDNPDYWGGYLSQVEIYNEALTGVQISSIWNSTKSRYGL